MGRLALSEGGLILLRITTPLIPSLSRRGNKKRFFVSRSRGGRPDVFCRDRGCWIPQSFKAQNHFLKTMVGFVFFFTALSSAQNATFVASAERTTVGANEQFEVLFTASGSDLNSMRNFHAPEFGKLVVLTGPSQSTNVQIVNGQMNSSLTLSYTLYAREPGKYTIGPASIEYKGTSLRTQPLHIEVVKGSPQQKQGAADAVNISNSVFLRATADKQRAKQGEQITVTYKLYFNVRVSGYDIARAPVYQGFWSEDLEQPKQPTVTTEILEGKQYNVAVIRRTALFATQPGKLTIAPLEVRCNVQVPSRKRSNDPFDSFFNDPFFSRLQTVDQEFKSNSLPVTVDALPGTPPAEYTGAVGAFSFTTSVDHNKVKTGDPITLRLSVSGTGNVKLLTIPKPILPSDFEAYEPKISEELTRDGGVVKGKKTAEYLVIPRNAGQRTIEPISFTYFNLEKNGYSTIRSPKYEFTITQGKDMGAGTTIASKSDIKLLGEDIRFLKLSVGELQRVNESPFTGAWLYLGIILPPFMFIGAFVYRRRIEKLSGNVRRLRFAKAGKEAAKRLKQARKLFAQGNTEQYHAEVSKALMGYLQDKLHGSRASLSLEDAVIQLEQKGVSKETLRQLTLCIERAEFARFAPSSDTKEARAELLDAAASAINAIEKSFNGA